MLLKYHRLYRMYVFVLGARFLQIPIGCLIGGQTAEASNQQSLGSITIALIVAQCITKFKILITSHTSFKILIIKTNIQDNCVIRYSLAYLNALKHFSSFSYKCFYVALFRC